MPNYCSVCGRELTKSEGPIGPKCLQKIRPRNIRVRGITKAQYAKMWAKYDMYGDKDGQKEDDPASEGTEGQEACSDGDSGETAAPES